jgi:putative addiction module component (TIGR02574 family)
MVIIDIDSLTRDEKLDLIDQLYASLESGADEAFVMTPWHRAILDERWAEIQRDGSAGEPWDVVHRKLLANLSAETASPE